ncbi:L-threonine O-3-phosphate decarboxylase [Thermodesulfitimonas autotrophica]|uniref:threonine-phosphate decarboxylase n=1 Tax=Thermodesulfitimonas autotrophica TaxID=1894989 RepID=A0A3N5B141_9THEO|nr:threonine-phosphate decarboxylase CobD [Thermodesulfitimonas autotrophica]RPF42552.1 L-threonine O-3-phosphate decarboxylase [Thermodesulfitimonas autotrophica]
MNTSLTRWQHHGGNPYRAAREWGGWPDEYLDFSCNINPLGPSPRVLACLQAAAGEIWRYPDPECTALKEALGAYLGVPAAWLIPGNGTAELINLLVPALGIRRAVVPAPAFAEYALSVTAWGGEIRYLYLKGEDFAFPWEELPAALAGADALFLCQPNNPTGRLLAPDELERLAAATARAGAYLVVDEAFLDFLPDAAALTALNLLPRWEHLVVLRSLTKFFALAGLRLGVLVALSPLQREILSLLPPWNVNSLAQVAGVAAVADAEYISESRRVVATERAYLASALASLPGVRVVPGVANFLLLDIRGTGFSSAALARRLAQERVLVRDTANFPGLGGGFIRVAVRLRAENERLVGTLGAVLRAAPGQG